MLAEALLFRRFHLRPIRGALVVARHSSERDFIYVTTHAEPVGGATARCPDEAGK